MLEKADQKQQPCMKQEKFGKKKISKDVITSDGGPSYHWGR